MAVITVLGSGIMATALATPLTDNGHEVRLVGTHLDREIITSIQETGIHPNLGLKVPEGVTAHQLEDAPRAFEGVEFVMSGVNSFGVDWAGDQFASLLRPGMHVIALAKGMQADDDGNLTILPRALASRLPEELRSRVSVSAIAGPSIAGEVAVHRHTERRVHRRGSRGSGAPGANCSPPSTTTCGPTRTSWVSRSVPQLRTAYAFGADSCRACSTPWVRPPGTVTSTTTTGRPCSARASVEMVQFMELLGGQPTTPIGLPGIGDCFVTSMGGRNVRCGRLVGSGMTFSQARAQMPGVTLEGAAAIVVIGKAMVRLTERGIVPPERFPLLRHLYEVVGLDQPVAVPWDTFFGSNGSGQA